MIVNTIWMCLFLNIESVVENEWSRIFGHVSTADAVADTSYESTH